MRIQFVLRAMLVAATLAAMACPAAAQNPVAARSLAATCTACHGPDGVSVGGVPPSLAGKNRDYLLQQLRDFRDGKRPATIMHQHARGYTDAQLEQIAAYFSSVTPGAATPAPRAGN